MTIEFTKEELYEMFIELQARVSHLEEYINGCKEGEKIFKEMMKEVQFQEDRPVLKPYQTKEDK